MKEKLNWLYIKEVRPDISGFFLLLAVVVFTFLRFPSLFEPEWYGDEGIYQVIGRAMLNGRLLYAQIWDNKPPLLYVYYALVNGDLFWIRLLSIVFGIGAIVSFFFLARNIFQNKKLPVFSSTLTLAVLFGLPLIEGNIANAENFILFPVVLSLFLITKIKSSSSSTLPIASGVILSAAVLTKSVAVFDLFAFILILFSLRFYNKPLIDVKKHFLSKPLEFIKLMKQEVLIIISFFTPIILVSLFFIFRGAFVDYIKATFSQNIGYVGYANYFIIPQGLLIIKLFLLVFGVFLIVAYRRRLGPSGIVVYSWLLFSLFNAFFSGRPYTHYVLVVIPSLCLLIGLVLSGRKNLFFNFIVLVFIIILLRTNFTYYTKISAYYRNYLEFVVDGKSVEAYQSFFDSNVPGNYKIAQFIKSSTSNQDNVFILSDSSTIYYLADKLPPGRYIVEYHISFYNDAISETQNAIDLKKPKFIIVTKDRLANEFIRNYAPKYKMEGAVIYEREI